MIYSFAEKGIRQSFEEATLTGRSGQGTLAKRPNGTCRGGESIGVQSPGSTQSTLVPPAQNRCDQGAGTSTLRKKHLYLKAL